jgi:transposase
MTTYTTNDAINILYKCGIKTHGTLKMYLKNGGFKISDSSLWSKLAELDENGLVVDNRKSHSGRKAYLTEKDKTGIMALLAKDPEKDAAEIKAKLKLQCSTLPIRNFLKEVGFKFLRILSVPRLTPKKKEARLNFARKHRHDDWTSTFFLDESKFQVGSHRRYCYQRPKSRRTAQVDKFPEKLNLIGMISLNGGSRLITFEENLRADLFIDFLKDLKKDADKLYRRKSYRLVMDGDSKHTAGITKTYIKEASLKYLDDWPANSPDLNPIENIWGIMEKHIKKMHVVNKPSLEVALKSVWRKLTTKEKLKPLIDSMEERMKAVLASKGSKIKF